MEVTVFLSAEYQSFYKYLMIISIMLVNFFQLFLAEYIVPRKPASFDLDIALGHHYDNSISEITCLINNVLTS
jgi:hypothetical protein